MLRLKKIFYDYILSVQLCALKDNEHSFLTEHKFQVITFIIYEF